MKFGFRIPSLTKRIAAGTSLKRAVKNSLGLKAPRGWGWLTNPKKAAYNRVYNRTTVGCGTLVILALVVVVFLVVIATAEEFKSQGTTDVYFSPNGGATEVIVHEINAARSEILVQAYSFTSKPIAKALVEARKRGIKIEAVLDKSQRKEKYTSADFVAHAGIPTYIDASHAIAHNKIIIIDRSTLITGSFNFTKAAEEKNAENMLILKGNKPLVDRYIRNFEAHKSHSEGYQGK